MVKKIRLDFSKVEDRAGWKTDNMPEGLHEMKVELVDDKDAGDGTPMLTYGLRPTNPKYKTRLFPYYCKQQANQYFKLRDLHIAAGVLDPKKAKGKAVDIYPDAPIEKLVAAEVVDSRNPQYAGRSEIDGVYDASILEDEDGTEPDDDDEEYDDEEPEEDEVDEDEDEDEEEDLEDLSLPELRKRAKELGIATAGLKKADLIDAILDEDGDDEDDEDEDELDDDDLDDEDLEDEEFEDDEEDEDEEEEEPAPKRRAPAKKAPAKAAPKRSVRRR